MDGLLGGTMFLLVYLLGISAANASLGRVYKWRPDRYMRMAMGTEQMDVEAALM